MIDYDLFTKRSDKPEYEERVLVLDKTDLRLGAEKLHINEIDYTHIKGSPKLFYKANLVILNLMRGGTIQTKVLKNRWGRSGVVGGPQEW